MLGALTDSYLKDCKGYVRNREKWFETRISKIKEQMTKNPEFFISLPQQARKEQSKSPTPSGIKRTNTFETEIYDPKSPRGRILLDLPSLTPIEIPRTLSVTMIETVPQGSPSNSDKAAAGFYLTSLMDEDEITKGNKDSVVDMFISEPPKTKRSEKKKGKYASPNRQGSINESALSRYISRKALDLSLERIKTPYELTPERVDSRKKRQMKKLFDCGIFEKNAEEPSFELGLQQRSDLNYSLFLPEIRHASTSPVHYERERERSQKEVREKQRAIPNARNYFAEKERLLEKLEKKSCQTWDLQNHLAKMMKEKCELNKRINNLKRNNIALERRPLLSKVIPPITQRKQSLPLITETERATEHPCVVVQVPKKYASVREDNKGVRLISRSHIQSPIYDDEYRGPAQKGFVSNISEFQDKINGWKGPYAMLNKRLKRKFVRSHFENLHIGVEYT